MDMQLPPKHNDSKPHTYISMDDENGKEWIVHLEGEYEPYPDGMSIVSDLLPKAYYEGEWHEVDEASVPIQVIELVEAVLDDKDIYLEVCREYEEAMKR